MIKTEYKKNNWLFKLLMLVHFCANDIRHKNIVIQVVSILIFILQFGWLNCYPIRTLYSNSHNDNCFILLFNLCARKFQAVNYSLSDLFLMILTNSFVHKRLFGVQNLSGINRQHCTLFADCYLAHNDFTLIQRVLQYQHNILKTLSTNQIDY